MQVAALAQVVMRKGCSAADPQAALPPLVTLADKALPFDPQSAYSSVYLQSSGRFKSLSQGWTAVHL